MVLKKRLEYGFGGFQIPCVPRGPRSVRRRHPLKSLEDNQICAFELLATVAGKLLQESESSASSNIAADEEKGIVKQEKIEASGKYVKSDQGSSVSDPVIEVQKIEDNGFGGSLYPKDCSLQEQTSKVFNGNGKLGIEIETHIEEDLTVANDRTVKDPMENNYVNNNNTLHLVNSESSVHFPLYRERFPRVCFAKHRNDVKLGVRDDGENSYGCYKHSTKIRPFRSQSRIGYKRIRKMLTSRHRKTALGLKECDFSDTYEKAMKHSYRSRKIFHARERCHFETSSKRRKLCNRSFAIAYDQEASSESISNLPDKRINGDNIKFSIKSFKVPELYIEVPETATVGSLKRTVMEAVTAIVAGGLRVGVVLQGKKVRDDNRTLKQAGISHNGNIDALGFTLEPNLSQVSLVSTPKDAPSSLRAAVETEVSGSPASPNLDLALSTIPSDPSPEIIMDKPVEGNRELVPFSENPTDSSTNLCDSDTKALVAVPPSNAEALAIVPLNGKSKRTELSQRRTRRPFSVAEVDGLVGAVEQLGTGRWRDVKMRAFENADHRTYVDLKDKWKTLVHTASIAPQQRRGEPVPQELLNRVLAAHSYWSQHQAKQHGKSHATLPLRTEV
ncbi:PREDICTED: telomere repeat-binding protein 4-like [Ipomoea nil]|uniref:telomere repeat-binding protein 4-like n=1 Tax=Ipomoea nil TaxID=35883 RepID=UPI0009017B9E|nr:PREDICTED: telomere repeat-binding protein 4-like [Ipomoea nil]